MSEAHGLLKGNWRNWLSGGGRREKGVRISRWWVWDERRASQVSLSSWFLLFLLLVLLFNNTHTHTHRHMLTQTGRQTHTFTVLPPQPSCLPTTLPTGGTHQTHKETWGNIHLQDSKVSPPPPSIPIFTGVASQACGLFVFSSSAAALRGESDTLKS